MTAPCTPVALKPPAAQLTLRRTEAKYLLGSALALAYGSTQTQVTMDGSVYTSVAGGMGGPGAGRPDGMGFSPDQWQAPQKMG